MPLHVLIKKAEAERVCPHKLEMALESEDPHAALLKVMVTNDELEQSPDHGCLSKRFGPGFWQKQAQTTIERAYQKRVLFVKDLRIPPPHGHLLWPK